MARKRQDEGNVAVLDAPKDEAELAPLAPMPVVEQTYEFRFALKAKWLAPFVVVVGCKTEEEARAELHRYLDAAIANVNRTGR